MSTKENDYIISSVTKALKILKLFDQKHVQMSLTEISQYSGLTKSSALRMLESLESEGFVYRYGETKKYKLGIELFKLGNSGYEFVDFKNVAYPFIKKAVDATGLIAHLGILEDNKMLIISKVWPNNYMENMAMVSLVGGVVPAHCTGVGKVLTAFSDEETRRKILDDCDFEKYTENTIVTREELMSELMKIRKQGYANNCGEHEPYIKCTTYPIINYNNKILGAISLTGLTQVVEEMDNKMIHSAIQEAVRGIVGESGL